MGMAQNHYEVYIKNRVNISQSEVDKDSDQIKGIVDKMISDFENRDKKIMLEKFKIMISREMKNDDDYKKFSTKDEALFYSELANKKDEKIYFGKLFEITKKQNEYFEDIINNIKKSDRYKEEKY